MTLWVILAPVWRDEVEWRAMIGELEWFLLIGGVILNGLM